MKTVRVESFEQQFEEEETEIYALVKTEVTGSAFYQKDYRRQNVYTYAIMDAKTHTVDRREGILTWLISAEGTGPDFKQYGIYRLLVRKAKPVELTPVRRRSWNNRYLVMKVMMKWKKVPELEELSAYLKQPKYLHTAIGEFRLDRTNSQYHCSLNTVEIVLDVDKDSEESCLVSLSTFQRYENDLPELDQRLRRFAAEHLLKKACEWTEKNISEDEFISRIGPALYAFDHQGSFEVYYDDGDLFAGHSIIVDVNKNGVPEHADIAG